MASSISKRVGTEDAGNVGIVALSAKRNYERPTQVQVFVRLQNFGPQPVDAPVQLTVDGEIVEANGSRTEAAFLLPDRWTRDERDKWEKDNGRQQSDSVTFDLDLTSAAVLTVKQLHHGGDVLAADDIAQVIVPAPKQLAVLLVTDGNYFLERLMSNLDLKSPDIMQPASYEQKQPGNYDVIIFDRYTPKWLPEAGNFIYVDSVPPHTDGPGQKVTVEKDADGNPALVDDEGVLDWNRDHPILKDLAMNRLYIEHALKLQVPADAQVLVDGLKVPLIVLAHDAKRTNLILGFDPNDGNWPLEYSYPMFWHHALQFLAVGSDMDVRQSYEPGRLARHPAGQPRAGSPRPQAAQARRPRRPAHAPPPPHWRLRPSAAQSCRGLRHRPTCPAVREDRRQPAGREREQHPPRHRRPRRRQGADRKRQRPAIPPRVVVVPGHLRRPPPALHRMVGLHPPGALVDSRDTAFQAVPGTSLIQISVALM